MLSEPHTLLGATAAGVAFLHTLLGPDHYLPFVSLGRAEAWSRPKLAGVTAACGLGHVLSSVVLALAGAALGLGLTQLEAFQAIQARWAAWGLVAFGLIYGTWGVTRALRHRPHAHGHSHADGGWHVHPHAHTGEHLHPHVPHGEARASARAPWMLFTLFLLGPCEPMIPLVMYPAALRDWAGLVTVVAIFSVVTVGTMVAVTLACDHGVRVDPGVEPARTPSMQDSRGVRPGGHCWGLEGKR
jgi:hypothetical protein